MTATPTVEDVRERLTTRTTAQLLTMLSMLEVIDRRMGPEGRPERAQLASAIEWVIRSRATPAQLRAHRALTLRNIDLLGTPAESLRLTTAGLWRRALQA